MIERCVRACARRRGAAPSTSSSTPAAPSSGAHLAPRAAPRDDLNERQRQLLDHLAVHGRCTNREYIELTGTSDRTGLRDLQDLIDRGLIVREGKRRGAVYRLA